MSRANNKDWLLSALLIIASLGEVIGQPSDLETKFLLLRDNTVWKEFAAVPLLFPSYHPQGMVKIGTYFFMSSVEVHDRSAGRGVGHLLKFDEAGNLLADTRLGEGAMYHPGGIDFDGKYIWVSVAEYRSASNSIVYRIDPDRQEITETFRFRDHLGGVVYDSDARKLYGINWGARDFYEWSLDFEDKVDPLAVDRTANTSFYIDYQDCQYVGNHQMICGGLKTYRNANSLFRLGGLELVDLTSHQPLHQIPFQFWSPSGKPMTQNPIWLESTIEGIKAYFVPDDDESTLYVYETIFR